MLIALYGRAPAHLILKMMKSLKNLTGTGGLVVFKQRQSHHDRVMYRQISVERNTG